MDKNVKAQGPRGRLVGMGNKQDLDPLLDVHAARPLDAEVAAQLSAVSISHMIGRGLRDFWRMVTSNGKVATGSVIVGIFVLVAIFGPFFMIDNPTTTSRLFLTHPSIQHLLGTTEVGEDIFSQLIYGTRTSLFWGLLTGLLVTVV